MEIKLPDDREWNKRYTYRGEKKCGKMSERTLKNFAYAYSPAYILFDDLHQIHGLRVQDEVERCILT